MTREVDRRPWKTPEAMLHFINVNSKNQSSFLYIAQSVPLALHVLGCASNET